MSSVLRQYSIDEVDLSWFGLDIKEGLAVGTSIVESRNSASWATTPHGQGGGTRSYNPDRTGTVTITVDQTSTLHQKLLALSASERTPAGRNKVGVMKMKDQSSGYETNWLNAFIMTDPEVARGTEAATFAWVFQYVGYDAFPNEANSTNLVGS